MDMEQKRYHILAVQTQQSAKRTAPAVIFLPTAAMPLRFLSPTLGIDSEDGPPKKKLKPGRKSKAEQNELDEMMHQLLLDSSLTNCAGLCVDLSANMPSSTYGGVCNGSFIQTLV